MGNLNGSMEANSGRILAERGSQNMSSLISTDVAIAQPFKRGVVPKPSEGINSCTEMWTDKYPGLDKNIVVEKLIKIQKQQKKLIEKSEVMEEQVFQLTEELKKKNKIIQYYVLREETGTLGAAGKDTLLFNKIYAQKVTNKQTGLSEHRKSAAKSLVNQTSKLSSLFNPTNGASSHRAAAEGPESPGTPGETLNGHFYKELNTRLQSVLEDTILKNMKLQENLDIMSSEVQYLKEATNHRHQTTSNSSDQLTPTPALTTIIASSTEGGTSLANGDGQNFTFHSSGHNKTSAVESNAQSSSKHKEHQAKMKSCEQSVNGNISKRSGSKTAEEMLINSSCSAATKNS